MDAALTDGGAVQNCDMVALMEPVRFICFALLLLTSMAAASEPAQKIWATVKNETIGPEWRHSFGRGFPRTPKAQARLLESVVEMRLLENWAANNGAGEHLQAALRWARGARPYHNIQADREQRLVALDALVALDSLREMDRSYLYVDMPGEGQLFTEMPLPGQPSVALQGACITANDGSARETLRWLRDADPQLPLVQRIPP